MPLAAAYRFALTEATIHWSHTTTTIDLVITTDGGDLVIDATITDHGDYWDTDFVPRSSSLQLRGTLTDEAPDRVRIAITPPAPIAAIEIDPRRTKFEVLETPERSEPLPDFWAPLVAWAEAHFMKPASDP